MKERSPSTPDDLMDQIADEITLENQKIASTSRFLEQTFLSSELVEAINRSLPSFDTDTDIHILKFLKYKDLAFILLAYKSVLKREADSVSLYKYLSLLREGKITRPEILNTLKNSDEGKSLQTRITYLTPFCIASRTYRRLLRLPVLGWCIRFFWGLTMLPHYSTIIGAISVHDYGPLINNSSSAEPHLLRIDIALEQMQEAMSSLIKSDNISKESSKSLIAIHSKLKELENKIDSIHKDTNHEDMKDNPPNF